MSGAHIRANEVQKTIEPVRLPGRELLRQQEQGPAQAVAPQVAYCNAQINRNGLRPADLLALQRAVGNRTVQRMVAKHVNNANDEQQGETTEENFESTVQTKLTVGAPKDISEQESDRIAGQVMTMPDAATQRPNQTGLPDGLKSGIESLSGIALDNVRAHYNSSQPAQLNALAYAQGSDIYVAPGQEQHLPHEAWHVVQQAQGRVQPTMQMMEGVPVNDDVGLEREADVMGQRAIRAQRKDSMASRAVSWLTGKVPAVADNVVQRRTQMTPVQAIVEAETAATSWAQANKLPKPNNTGNQATHVLAKADSEATMKGWEGKGKLADLYRRAGPSASDMKDIDLKLATTLKGPQASEFNFHVATDKDLQSEIEAEKKAKAKADTNAAQEQRKKWEEVQTIVLDAVKDQNKNKVNWARLGDAVNWKEIVNDIEMETDKKEVASQGHALKLTPLVLIMITKLQKTAKADLEALEAEQRRSKEKAKTKEKKEKKKK